MQPVQLEELTGALRLEERHQRVIVYAHLWGSLLPAQEKRWHQRALELKPRMGLTMCHLHFG